MTTTNNTPRLIELRRNSSDRQGARAIQRLICGGIHLMDPQRDVAAVEAMTPELKARARAIFIAYENLCQSADDLVTEIETNLIKGSAK